MTRFEVTFQPARTAGRVPAGSTVVEAARQLGLRLDAPCAGAGTCGKCVVQVRRGTSLETVLGCLAVVDSDMEVTLPSLEPSAVQTVEGFRPAGRTAAARTSPVPARTGFGVALDLGTTTLVAALVDLASGRVVCRSSMLCPLVAQGHDVLSRIRWAVEHPRGLRTMQRDLVAAASLLAKRLACEADLSAEAVSTVVAAGNTTMQHIFLGLPVAGLGEHPYRAATLDACTRSAREIGLGVLPDARITTMPCISAYVGGDIVAGLLAVGAEAIDRPALMVDVGTNGEIALLVRDGILAASTAAGPCFEGMTIHCGMRASEGAIQHVEVRDEVRLDVVGGGRPRGICGSALLDLVAELRRTGVIAPSGRLAPRDGGRLGLRILDEDGRRRFLVADDVFVTQEDIRQVQLAKAAIRAGVDVLLAEAATPAAELRSVLVAGAFGYHAREASILGLGLMPPELRGKLAFVGNASLEGGVAVLVDHTLLDQARRMARGARVVDLSAAPSFPAAFREGMGL